MELEKELELEGEKEGELGGAAGRRSGWAVVCPDGPTPFFVLDVAGSLGKPLPAGLCWTLSGHSANEALWD